MKERPKNLAASVRARLTQRARARSEDFQFLLQRYAAERLLYRIAQSRHRESFVLKGAMLLVVWGGDAYRATWDLDLLGRRSNDPAGVLASFREICSLDLLDEALAFDPATLRTEDINPEAEYRGVRLKVGARLEQARITLQVDVGFGHAVVPPPQEVDFPTLLGEAAPRIRAYTPEVVIAEKFHAMVTLGERNSRFKDFYDVYTLSRTFRFDGPTLARAISSTFEARDTIVPAAPVALSSRFYEDEERAGKWRAELAKKGLAGAPRDLAAVGEAIRAFLGPVVDALATGRAPGVDWPAEGPWPLANATRAYARYPSYRDSGVEWLGQIPAHWEVRKFTREVRITRGQVDPEVEPYASMILIAPNHVEPGTGRLLGLESAAEQAAESGKYSCRVGDVIYSKIRPALAKVVIAPHDCLCSADMYPLTPGGRVDNRYLASLLLSPAFTAWTVLEADRVAMPKINRESLNSLKIPVPPASEQAAVVDYLQDAAERLDDLAARKRDLIRFLEEKRTALITRAVTRGLDPAVPTRQSGVEWLGEIPADWAVKRIKWVACLESGHTPDKRIPEYWADGDIPWVSLADTDQLRQVDRISDTAVRTTALGIANSSARLLPAGTVVFSRDATIGLAAIIDRPMSVSQHFIGWVCGPTVTPEYLLLVLRSMAGELDKMTMGATIKTIGLPDVKRLAIPIPPLNEQEAIVAQVMTKRAEIDGLIARVQDGIKLLAEYRGALITAAVTGQIDLREVAA